MLWLYGLPRKLRLRLVRRLKEPEGGFAAALMIGNRSSIPTNIASAMRNSGHAHLLVAAGRQLSFVAGCPDFYFSLSFRPG
jgi:predicted membrane metal-binding protein